MQSESESVGFWQQTLSRVTNMGHWSLSHIVITHIPLAKKLNTADRINFITRKCAETIFFLFLSTVILDRHISEQHSRWLQLRSCRTHIWWPIFSGLYTTLPFLVVNFRPAWFFPIERPHCGEEVPTSNTSWMALRKQWKLYSIKPTKTIKTKVDRSCYLWRNLQRLSVALCNTKYQLTLNLSVVVFMQPPNSVTAHKDSIWWDPACAGPSHILYVTKHHIKVPHQGVFIAFGMTKLGIEPMTYQSQSRHYTTRPESCWSRVFYTSKRVCFQSHL